MSPFAMSRSGVVLATLAAVLMTCAATRSHAVGIYDLYELGIQIGELRLDADTDGTNVSLTLRLRDRRTRDWTAPQSAHIDSDLDSIKLPGSLGRLTRGLGSLGSIDWSSLEAVGWPDRNTIYERHRRLQERVRGEQVAADYWAVRDASSPLDLLIDMNNQLVAAIDVSRDLVLVRQGFESFTTVGRWQQPDISPADFGLGEPDTIQVPMTDGTRLATLVYLPTSKEREALGKRFPTILVRTPYGLTGTIDRYWHHVARGYAVVLQSTRGRTYWDPEYRSEGDWRVVVDEPKDGATTLEWITAQPWSNGKIGMQGASYVGYTQWAATLADNPALECIVPESSMGTAFSDQPYMGGGFVSGFAYYVFWMTEAPLLPGRTWEQVLKHRPLVDIDTFATGRDIPQWNDVLENWINGDYWSGQNWYRDGLERNFASFQISGWFDDDFPGTRANWELMQTHGKRPQRLLIGPWKHGYNRDRSLNGYDFGVDALRDDVWLLKQKWYDSCLKGIDSDVDETRVDYFVLGENTWRTATAWPPPDAVSQNWYLHSTGQAHRRMSDGRLLPRLPTEEQPADEYVYDPQDAPPNWMTFESMKRWEDVQSFPYDFRDTERRQDFVVYTSEPLDEELTIAGDILMVLHASTDVRDTDWWVHLSDVAPDGESVRLTVGMLRARFRHLDDPEHHISGENFASEQFLSGDLDEVVRYQIAVPSIANTFAKGHRIRIAIANASEFYSFPNSNTGEHEAHVTRTVPGRMKIHHNPTHPSHVVLPVLRPRRDG